MGYLEAEWGVGWGGVGDIQGTWSYSLPLEQYKSAYQPCDPTDVMVQRPVTSRQ